VLDSSNKATPFKIFIENQKSKNAYLKNIIEKSTLEIINILCQQCEDYVLEAASSAPPSISAKQYETMKTGRVFHPQSVENLLKRDKSITEQITMTLDEIKLNEESRKVIEKGEKDLEKGKQLKKLKKGEDKVASPREIFQELSSNSSVNVPYSVRAAVRLRCRRLVSLFRVIDYMIRDKLYDVLYSSLQTLSTVLLDCSYDQNNQKEDEFKNDSVIIPSSKYGSSVIPKRRFGLLQLNLVFLTTSSSSTAAAANALQLISEINCEPNKIHCLEDIRTILTEICSYCSYIDGLLSYEKCQRLFAPISSELSLTNILDDRIFLDNEQNQIQSTVKEILKFFFQECEKVLNEIKHLTVFREQCNENKLLYYEAQAKSLLNKSPEEISSQLNQWDTQILTICQMKSSQRISIFQVEYSQIQTDFLSIIQKNQILYYRLIPDLYVTNGDSFYHEISSLLDKLTMKYTNLDEFIKLIESFHYCQSIAEKMASKFKYIMNIREIIESRTAEALKKEREEKEAQEAAAAAEGGGNNNNTQQRRRTVLPGDTSNNLIEYQTPTIRISEAILRQNLTLTNTFSKFNNLLNDFHTEILEEQIKNYRNEMTFRYKKVILPIATFKSYIDSINIMMAIANDDYLPNVDDILEQLYHFQKEIAIVSSNLGILEYYQNMLGIIIFEKGLEIEISEQLKSNIFLWQSWKTLIDLTDSFMRISYLDANCEAIIKEVSILKSDLNGNHYLSMINDKVNRSGNTAVINAAMKIPSSSSNISQMLGRSISKDESSPAVKIESRVEAGERRRSVGGNAGGVIPSSFGHSNNNNEIEPATLGIYKCYHKILSMSSSLLEIVPLIQKLQSNTFKAEHINAIHSLLEESFCDNTSDMTEGEEEERKRKAAIYDDVDITVGELIDIIKIQDYANEIDHIYRQSTIQYNLEMKVTSYSKNLSFIEFSFLSDHDNKALIYINNFNDITSSLEDALITFQSISLSHAMIQSTSLSIPTTATGSTSSSPTIHQQVQDLIQDVTNWMKAITQFTIFQKKYLSYRTLFTSAKTARLLSSYMKYFKAIDENWRSLIRVAKSFIKIKDFFNEKSIYIILSSVTNNLLFIEKGINEIILDSCEKYPKLYLLDSLTMIDLFTSNNLSYLLSVISSYCFPFLINKLEIDSHESFNINGIYSNEEKLLFHKVVNGRTNLPDLCKSIENMINDRLERDIKELIFDDISSSSSSASSSSSSVSSGMMSMKQHSNLHSSSSSGVNSAYNRQLIDEIRNGKYCEQAYLLMFQIKFWSKIDQIFSPANSSSSSSDSNSSTMSSLRWNIALLDTNNLTNPSSSSSSSLSFDQDDIEEIKRSIYYHLRQLHGELNDQIVMISSLLTENLFSSLIIKRISNFIILILYYRDLLKSMIEDESGSLPTEKGHHSHQENHNNSHHNVKEGKGRNHHLHDHHASHHLLLRTDKVFFSIQKKVIHQNHLFHMSYHCYENSNVFLSSNGDGSSASLTNTSDSNRHDDHSSHLPNHPAHSSISHAGPLISIEQAGFMEKYGMKYQGFNNRLIILPIVDKCFFALSQAFRFKSFSSSSSVSPSSFQVPILQCQYPKSIIKSLSYEYGSDLLMMNTNDFFFSRNNADDHNKTTTMSSSISSSSPIQLITKAIMITFRCNLFFCLDSLETLSLEMLSTIGNLLSSIYHTIYIEKQDYHFKFNTNNTSNNNSSVTTTKPVVLSSQALLSSFSLPKFCFLHSNSFPNHFSQLFNTSHLFLPISSPNIPLLILLKALLTSYNFVYVNKISLRLESLINYLVSSHILERSFAIKTLLITIKEVGIENEHSKINISMQLNLISKKFFSSLPSFIQYRLSENEIRLICNLFLEIIYYSESDRKEFYSLLSPLQYSNTLKRMIFATSTATNLPFTAASSSSSSSSSLASGKPFLLPSLVHLDDQKLIEEKRENQLPSSSSKGIPSHQMIVVVGGSNVGKTTLIQSTLTSIQEELKSLTHNSPHHHHRSGLNRFSSQSEESNPNLVHSLSVYATPINPLLLIDIDNTANSLSSAGSGHTVTSRFNILFQKLIEKHINSVHQPMNIHFLFHLDFSSSLHLSYLLEPTLRFLEKFYFHRKIKLIGEITELYDIEPSMLTKLNILSISERIYTLEDVILKYFEMFTEK
jgi:hypothetical protein